MTFSQFLCTFGSISTNLPSFGSVNKAFSKARALQGLYVVTTAQYLTFWRVLTFLTVDDTSDQKMPPCKMQ